MKYGFEFINPWLVLIGLTLVNFQGRVLAQAEVDLDWKEIREFVNYPTYHASWPTLDSVLGTPEGIKRLGLPVHGHWVHTYVNPIAAAYIARHKDDPAANEPLELPAGSCIVKENFGFGGPDLNPTPKPGVLTVMYKNGKGFRQTNLESFNGRDGFLGGNWFFAFFALGNKDWQTKGMNSLEGHVQSHVTSFCISCHSPAFETDYLRTVKSNFFPYSQPPTSSYCDRVQQVLPVRQSLKPSEIPARYRDLGAKLDAYCNPTSLSPHLPDDVPFDPNIVFKYYGSKATQAMFDCFAWKTFIHLNWPNTGKPEDRGVPDSSKSFSGTRSGPTVWETYKPTYEVFQPSQADWNPSGQPWNVEQPAVDCKVGTDTTGKLALTMSSKIRDVVNEEGQAFAGTFGYLVDQNGERVHYEVLFNRTEFEYIKGHAATKFLTPIGPEKDGVLQEISFPDNRSDPKKVGSIEVKSAWKTLAIGPPSYENPNPDAATIQEAKKKFYVRKLHVFDAETSTCVEKTLGLVGLHVAHKTYYSPQWIWMTFEHKDNVPAYGKKTRASFFNPEIAAYIPPNPVPQDCWSLPFLSSSTCVQACPNVDLNRFVFPDAPNQITRLDRVGPEAQVFNGIFPDLMNKEGGSAFSNYILIDTQWPLHGRDENGSISQLNCADNGIDSNEECFTMVPPHLRNTSMESFMSTYCTASDGRDKTAVKQFSNRSCMGCHGTAGTDFSYVFLDAVGQRVPLKQSR